MFVYNVKVSPKKILKFVLVLLLIFLVVIGIVVFKNFHFTSSLDTSGSDDIYYITSSNYTNILKAVHDDIDTYIGQKINFSGYVYRVYDLQENEFVLARDMVITSDFETLVVGFLCSCETASNFDNGTWVSITGTIEKGYYHEDIPIINIYQIEEIMQPTDSYVYPPDDYYIPTSSLLYNNL